jgi:hypothetical protein
LWKVQSRLSPDTARLRSRRRTGPGAGRRGGTLYRALDWLAVRQPAIETALARRHLAGGTLVLYDVTSSYMEGRCCPLAQFGYNRDGKKGKLQIVYGLLCAPDGAPDAYLTEKSCWDEPICLGSTDPRRTPRPPHRPALASSQAPIAGCGGGIIRSRPRRAALETSMSPTSRSPAVSDTAKQSARRASGRRLTFPPCNGTGLPRFRRQRAQFFARSA